MKSNLHTDGSVIIAIYFLQAVEFIKFFHSMSRVTLRGNERTETSKLYTEFTTHHTGPRFLKDRK